MALQAAIGATLFGVGMQLGSGCACGTLYAIGGGSGLMLFTLVSFSAGSFLATLTPAPWRALPWLAPVSLLERWGWGGAAASAAGAATAAAVITALARPWRRRSTSGRGGRAMDRITVMVQINMPRNAL